MEKNEAYYIEKARSGDTEAFYYLYGKYSPVVYAVQKRYFLKGVDSDDWAQEGRIVFFQSILSFSGEKGLTLGRYFKMNFERHIFSLLRKQQALKRRVDHLSTSLDEKLENQGEQFLVAEGYTTTSSYDSINVRDQLKNFDSQLSDFERDIFQNYLAGKSIEEMVEIFNCETHKIKNALDRSRKKLKNYLYRR